MWYKIWQVFVNRAHDLSDIDKCFPTNAPIKDIIDWAVSLYEWFNKMYWRGNLKWHRAVLKFWEAWKWVSPYGICSCTILQMLLGTKGAEHRNWQYICRFQRAYQISFPYKILIWHVKFISIRNAGRGTEYDELFMQRDLGDVVRYEIESETSAKHWHVVGLIWVEAFINLVWARCALDKT